jgi:hypothetical protein
MILKIFLLNFCGVKENIKFNLNISFSVDNNELQKINKNRTSNQESMK